MRRDIGEARIGIALARLERLAQEAVDRHPVGIEGRPGEQRRRQRHVEKRREAKEAARPERRPGAGRTPILRTGAQPILEHHQEAGEQDEQVDAEIGLAQHRQAEAGEDHQVPEQHPERRQPAQSVETFDSSDVGRPNVHRTPPTPPAVPRHDSRIRSPDRRASPPVDACRAPLPGARAISP